ncbi:MAG: hypothetical protein WBV48_21005, partial [Candidatus Acidiferrales bacterium]
GALPVRTVEVNSEEPLGSHGYEESVRRACCAAKAEEQRMLEENFRYHGCAVEVHPDWQWQQNKARMAKENDSRPNNDEQIPA